MKNYKKETFEEFLQEIHYQLFPTVLDDDLPDHFDAWLSDMDVVEKCMEWAELYGRQQYIAGQEDILLHKNK